MYKLTYSLARINPSLQVDITVFMQDEDTLKLSNVKDKEKFLSLNKFIIQGDKYSKINLNPFVDLIIDPMQKEIYDKYKHIRLGKFDIYKLTRALDRIEEIFKKETDLFYYYEDKLRMNEEKKQRATLILQLRDRTLKIEPTIIMDNETNRQHEGIIIFVNTNSTYCLLTYLEMGYLNYVLKNTDVDSVASLLYMINHITDSDCKFRDLSSIRKTEDIVEPTPDDETVSQPPKIENTIPNI